MDAGRSSERVLIVDDDPSYLRYLDLRLQLEGHHTYMAASAEDALGAVEPFEPTLVITDVVLPGMNGLELVRRLRSDGRHRRLPILILTGADHSAEVGEVVGLGLVWYLRKGCEWSLVRRTVRNLATRAREMLLAS
jgi:two-component system alkaline phosphatase synthesis response regulator PhoP